MDTIKKNDTEVRELTLEEMELVEGGWWGHHGQIPSRNNLYGTVQVEGVTLKLAD